MCYKYRDRKEMEDHTIELLARQYFSGVISRKDERTLEQFITSSVENVELFRTWEREWAENNSSIIPEGTVAELHNKINTSYFDNVISSYKRRLHITRTSLYAASITLIIALFTTTAGLLLKNEAGSFDISAPAGGLCAATLPDGTLVWLNAESKIYVPETFNKNSREINLDGEAYFEVAKDEKKLFVVSSDNCKITVRGTKFNVRSYPENETVLTSVIDGVVDVSLKEATVRIQKDQAAVVNKKTGQITVESINAMSSKSWTDNRIEYRDITLSDLVAIVSRKFDVGFQIENEKVKNERLNISLRNNESLSDVLTALELILPIEITEIEGTIYIK